MRRNCVKTYLVSFAFILAVSPTAFGGKIIYVDDDASGLSNGESWANAYKFLQDALADANSSPKPVEIRVAKGIYKPDQGGGKTPRDRQATFQLINGVTLKGGYAGFGEPDPNARNIKLYVTVLSGDLDGNDVDVNDPRDLLTEPTRAENSYHVVTGSGTDANAVIDGLTITAGNANGSALLDCGGGMYSDSGNPTLENCTFSENSAYYYGGMYNYNYSSPILTNCTFSGNSAITGGGMGNSKYSNPILTNCTFRGNCKRRSKTAAGIEAEQNCGTSR